MRQGLRLAVGISVAVSVWLLVSRAVDHDTRMASTVPGEELEESSAPTLTGIDSTAQAHVAELDAKRTKAQHKLDVHQSTDPIAPILDADKTLASRIRRLLETVPKDARDEAYGKLGKLLAETEGPATDILELLQSTDDEQTIAALYDLLRHNAMKMATPDERRAFGPMLRHNPSPQVRRAATRALIMTEAFRGGMGDEIRAVAKEMNGLIVEAIRTESSPIVLETAASLFFNWHQPVEVFVALQEAAQRLPTSRERRRIYQMTGRTLFLMDQGESQFRAFDDETDPERRNDIAAGVSEGGNAIGASTRGDDDAMRLQVPANRTRLLDLLAGTSDIAVRRRLLRASLHGLNCIVPTMLSSDSERRLAARFVRDVIANEPDETTREQLERFAALVETRGAAAIPSFAAIMRGTK